MRFVVKDAPDGWTIQVARASVLHRVLLIAAAFGIETDELLKWLRPHIEQYRRAAAEHAGDREMVPSSLRDVTRL